MSSLKKSALAVALLGSLSLGFAAPTQTYPEQRRSPFRSSGPPLKVGNRKDLRAERKAKRKAKKGSRR